MCRVFYGINSNYTAIFYGVPSCPIFCEEFQILKKGNGQIRRDIFKTADIAHIYHRDNNSIKFQY